MDDKQNRDFMLLSSLFAVLLETLEIIDKNETAKLRDHIREQRRLCRSLPAEKTRPTWSGFCNLISDNHFRRQFRMTRRVFDNLCNLLCLAAGEKTFRPETLEELPQFCLGAARIVLEFESRNLQATIRWFGRRYLEFPLQQWVSPP